MRFTKTLCSMLLVGCISNPREEPQAPVIDVPKPCITTNIQIEKIYSNKIILPNMETVQATYVEVKNDHIRFCTKWKVMERSYIEAKLLGVYGRGAIQISSKYHDSAVINAKDGEGVGKSLLHLYDYDFAIPTIRPLKDKCEDPKAKMYEVLNQKDVIPFKDIKLIRKKKR